MFTHILSNLPEEYQTIVYMLEEIIYDDNDPLTIKRICNKLSVKVFQMSEKSRPRTSREYEKPLYIKSQYKGTCTTCGNTGTIQRNSVIESVWTYQNVITVINPDFSRKTVGRESRKKNQGITVGIRRRAQPLQVRGPRYPMTIQRPHSTPNALAIPVQTTLTGTGIYTKPMASSRYTEDTSVRTGGIQ